MNLIVDIGNTFTKLAVFEADIATAFTTFEGIDLQHLQQFCEGNPGIKNAIVSTVKDYSEIINHYLNENYNTFIFSHLTPIPLTNLYHTPETLGKDRLAAAVAAHALFPKSAALSIDSGTAITFDLVTAAGEYLGGAISPGIYTRYRALHTFTGKLPLENFIGVAELIGVNTATSIQSGVLNGILAEVEGVIQRYREIYPEVKIILTGGDYYYFDKNLKVKTFAAPNLVLEGLNLILRYNLEKK